MIDRAYLLEKPPAPSSVKWYFDREIIPLLIDAAGSFEGVLEHVAVQTRKTPGLSIGLALGVGVVAGCLLPRRKRR